VRAVIAARSAVPRVVGQRGAGTGVAARDERAAARLYDDPRIDHIRCAVHWRVGSRFGILKARTGFHRQGVERSV
jgi:hypothetical protein